MRHSASARWLWGAVMTLGAVALLAGFLLPSALLAVCGFLASVAGLWALQSGPVRVGETDHGREVSALRADSSAPEVVPAVPECAPQAVRVPPGLEPETVLGALREAAASIGPVVAAHLWLADDQSGTLRRIAAVGPMIPSSQPEVLGRDGVLSLAASGGLAEFGPLAHVTAAGSTSTLWRYAIPVVAGETRGVAAVDFRSDGEPDVSGMPEITAPLRGSLAGSLGLHIAKVELETARMLIDAARDLSRILDPAEVLRASLARAMAVSNAQTGSIMLLDDSGRLVIEHAEGLPSEVIESTSLGEGEGIAGWVLASRQPLLIEDLPARTPAARRHGIRSAVSVPIADDDGILGVLNVGRRSFPARFTESHLGSIEVLGKQTATALRNARAVSESRELYFDTLKALAVALETKDPYSRGCTERVLTLTEALGGVFGLSDTDRDALRVAALLHDIGMSAAGEGVLVADRPLTTVERALLKMHPHVAAEMLAEGPAMRQVVPIVYHHHEWYDGHGYMNGIAGESIPLGARILAVADAFVAMTSQRPYRPAFSERDALQKLAEKAGTQFDPAVVDALRDVLDGGANRVPGSSGGVR